MPRRTLLSLVCLALILLLASSGTAQEIVKEGDAGDTLPRAAVLGDDGVQRASLTLDSYTFTPDRLIVQVGKPVVLTLTSVTFLVPHSFVLDAPSSGLEIHQEVGAGDTVVIRFLPTQAGTYPFYCDKTLLFFPSHQEEGMEGHLEVRA